jgi:Transposase, Mutator family
VALGINCAGERDVLGLWAGTGGEGAKAWMGMLAELRNRGVEDCCIVACDGLKGLPEAITEIWPQATVQLSSVHTSCWRGGPAGHRAVRGGPMQTRAFEALMQTCPSGRRRAA